MRDISNTIKGYDLARQGEWERARFVAFYGGFHKAKKITDLVKFPWEKKKRIVTANWREALAKEFGTLDKAVKQKLSNG